MRKKTTFVVLSISSIAGVVLACGGKIEQESTNTTVTAPTATATSTTPGRPGSSSSSSSGFGSSSSSSGNSEDCPIDTVVTVSQLEADPGWKPPTVAPGSCTDADLKQLEANFKDTSVTSFFDLRKKLSTACAACAVSNDTDKTWGPIVGEASSKGTTGFVNFGACFAFLDSEACGKALQFEQLCYGLACDDCAFTSSERQRCVSTAGNAGEPCATFRTTTASSCPNIGTTATKCNSIIDAVKVLCGPI